MIFANKMEQFCDANGVPLAGGKLWFYASGGAVELNTFSDSALTVANTNPVILNSAGRPPNNIYLSPVAYRAVLLTSGDILVVDCNDIVGDTPVAVIGDVGKAVGIIDDGGVAKYGLIPVASGALSYVTVVDEPTLSGAKTLASADFLLASDADFINVNFKESGGTNFIENVLMGTYRDKKQSIPTATGALVIDYSLGQVVDLTQTGVISSVSITNVPSNIGCHSITIIRRTPDTTARAFTFGSAFKWDNGVAPVFGIAPAKVEVVTCITVDGGVTWLGGSLEGL